MFVARHWCRDICAAIWLAKFNALGKYIGTLQVMNKKTCIRFAHNVSFSLFRPMSRFAQRCFVSPDVLLHVFLNVLFLWNLFCSTMFRFAQCFAGCLVSLNIWFCSFRSMFEPMFCWTSRLLNDVSFLPVFRLCFAQCFVLLSVSFCSTIFRSVCCARCFVLLNDVSFRLFSLAMFCFRFDVSTDLMLNVSP